MPQIPFVGASYLERSKNLDAQVCINLFPVLGESGTAKAVAALYGTPGSRKLVTLGTGPVRAQHVPTDGSDSIVISGGEVYRLAADMTSRLVGTVGGDALVGIEDNGTQAVIVTGDAGYILDLKSNTVTPISDEAFYGATSIGILNTYMVFNRPGTNQFYWTAPNDVTFDPLNFASAESNYEPIVRLFVNHNELLLFKETVTEIWRPSSDPDLVFTRDTNAAIEQGCAAPWSVMDMDNSVFWLGKNKEGAGIIWRLNGYTPTRVSTDAIESAIAGYSNIADAQAFAYQQEGHTFYMLTFPTARATWVFDAGTQLWHQRAYLDPANGKLDRHRANCHMYFAGMHIIGDCRNGTLSKLDLDYYQDGDDVMPAIRAAAHVTVPDSPWIIHNRVQVEMETGVGLNTGLGSAPVALLDWSNDGGHTWSNQHPKPMGAIGQYRARVRWNKLGRARDRVYRITISDPVKRVILSASLNPEQ